MNNWLVFYDVDEVAGRYDQSRGGWLVVMTKAVVGWVAGHYDQSRGWWVVVMTNAVVGGWSL